MGNLAYHIWFTPVRIKTPHREIKASDTAKRSILDVNGLPISVLSWGEPPFVLFIHGWTGRGTQAAPFLDNLISAGYGVISFDGPAHGETPGKQTNILEFAEVVVMLNKEFGPFSAAITHSFGGMIAAYTMSNGVKFEKVVCICPPADMDTLIDNFSRALTIPEEAIAVMLEKLGKVFDKDSWEDISTINNVKNFNNKALIIHDENDVDIPWQSGQSIADAWNGSTLIRTQGLGHRRILRDPGVVKSVTDFITR